MSESLTRFTANRADDTVRAARDGRFDEVVPWMERAGLMGRCDLLPVRADRLYCVYIIARFRFIKSF